MMNCHGSLRARQAGARGLIISPVLRNRTPDMRPYNWQSSVGIQHELAPGVALNVGYFRTWFGNFLPTRKSRRRPSIRCPGP
jgi:hypothetical protein